MMPDANIDTGGNYQAREIWDYIELVYDWIQEHEITYPSTPSRLAILPRLIAVLTSFEVNARLKV